MISYNPSIHLALSDDSSDFPESEEDFSTLEITKDDHAIIKLKEWQTYYLKFYFDTDSEFEKIIETYPELNVFQLSSFKQSGTFILDKVGDIYVINFQNYVGLSRIGPLKLNIINRKINEDQYHSLLSYITEQYIGLVYQFSRTNNNDKSHTGYSTERSLVGKNLDYINFLFLRQFLLNQSNSQPRIKEILNLILKEPHFKIQCDFISTRTELIRQLDPRRLMEAITTGNNLQKITADHSLSRNALALQLGDLSVDGSCYFPINIKDENKYHSFDTLENRFIKYFLEMLLKLLSDIKNKFEHEPTYFNPDLIKDIDSICTPIKNCLEDQLWREVTNMLFVPTSSQVLQRKEGYRQLLSLYSLLQLATRYHFNYMDFESLLESKDTNILYEYWCFFTVKDVLDDVLGNVTGFDMFIDKTSTQLNPELNEGFYLQYKNNIQLGFNITFPSSTKLQSFSDLIQSSNISYSQEYRPDIVIKCDDRYLILDAKHKLSNWDEDSELMSKPKKEDIDKMHTYREAIQNAEGAYILYPGATTVIYPIHGAKQTYEGVGAIKLIPNTDSHGNSAQSDDLRILINQFLDNNHGSVKRS